MRGQTRSKNWARRTLIPREPVPLKFLRVVSSVCDSTLEHTDLSVMTTWLQSLEAGDTAIWWVSYGSFERAHSSAGGAKVLLCPAGYLTCPCKPVLRTASQNAPEVLPVSAKHSRGWKRVWGQNHQKLVGADDLTYPQTWCLLLSGRLSLLARVGSCRSLP